MQLIFDVVLPVFAVILGGWYACRLGLITTPTVTGLNAYVMYFAVPPMLFQATAKADFENLVNPLFILAFFITSLITMLVGVLGYRSRSDTLLDSTVVALACGWGNTIYMGIPFAYYLFGEQGPLPVVMATLITNTLFIVWLSFIGNYQSSKNRWMQLKQTFMAMFVKNPVLIAPFLGGWVSYLNFQTPTALDNLFSMLAPSAAPVALFAMGASLFGLKISTQFRSISWVVVTKILINPAIAVVIVWLFELDSFWAASVILMAALPTGTMVFNFAKQYETKVTLASGSILLSTLLSLLTLAIVIPSIKYWF